MNIKHLFGGCLVASVLVFAVGCGSTDPVLGTNGGDGADAGPFGTTQGSPGTPGASGTTGASGNSGSQGAGAPGPAGPAGPAGHDGSGSNGTNGTNGTDGVNGEAGAAGVGEVGATGAQGDSGTPGDLLCGDTLIPAAEWHTACDVHAFPGWDANGSAVCKTGQVQCRASLVEGQLVLTKVCYGSVDALPSSGKCNEDLDCSGSADDTTGAGSNVALVRHALTYECPVSSSDGTCDRAFLHGLCRNAVEHCLGVDVCLDLKVSDGQVVVSCDGNGSPRQVPIHGNREGVVLSDFGDLSVATADEAKMGYECVDGSDVRTWDCVVGSNGVASVTCSGARGL